MGSPVLPGDVAALRSYRDHQQRRGLLPNSVRRLQADLHAAARHFAVNGASLLEATPDDIENFLDTKNIVARTRYQWVSILSTFYRWAVFADLVGVDPTVKVVRPKLRKYMPRPIATADLAYALSQAPRHIHAWLVLAAFDGCRCQEIAGLERGDVIDGAEPPILTIRHGKGDKPRAVPLHPYVALVLAGLPMPSRGPLFVNPKTGRAYTPKDISEMTNDFLHGIGIGATMHQVRHWFGTEAYRECRDILQVMRLLGHSSVTTTMGYCELVPGAEVATVNRLHIDVPRFAESEQPTLF